MKKYNIGPLKKIFWLLAAGALPVVSFAQEQQARNAASCFSNPLFNTLLAVIVILAMVVVALAGALKNIIGSDMFLEKIKNDKAQKNNGGVRSTGLILIFLLISAAAFSQQATARGVKDNSIGGLDQFTCYTMIVIIALELLVLGILFNTFKNILGTQKAAAEPVRETKSKTKTILDKLNDTVDLEQEDTIMLDHDYDGIKELDNNLPPWWKYGFYLTILISVIYMINYHITMTAPLQAEEYKNSIRKAEAEIAEYMKTSANNVDESTVKMLTASSDIAAGKDLFMANCAACHGKAGEGTVGPNLTDDYWIHSGSVKDIFKTIKYGWPDKGMKAWKEDFSPMQIAQLTSFIRTLKGTDPPKPKDKQGDLYVEGAGTDSAAVKQDTLKALSDNHPSSR